MACHCYRARRRAAVALADRSGLFRSSRVAADMANVEVGALVVVGVASCTAASALHMVRPAGSTSLRCSDAPPTALEHAPTVEQKQAVSSGAIDAWRQRHEEDE
mmetsp:Transcript_50640/g.147302  ORF Transcript_50640/g.147302 Transcript_50640/m.147302 type:complete len:104 (-) Transcript_50640:81-392(-)